MELCRVVLLRSKAHRGSVICTEESDVAGVTVDRIGTLPDARDESRPAYIRSWASYMRLVRNILSRNGNRDARDESTPSSPSPNSRIDGLTLLFTNQGYEWKSKNRLYDSNILL